MSGNIFNGFGNGNLRNGALINGICHIYQSTLPTTRPDGSPLVIADKFYNTAKTEEGFWDGTYWLSDTLYQSLLFSSDSTTAPASLWTSFCDFGKTVKIESYWMGATFTPAAIGDKWAANLVFKGNLVTTDIYAFPIIECVAVSTTSINYFTEVTINHVVNLTNAKAALLTISKTGATANVWVNLGISYRRVLL